MSKLSDEQRQLHKLVGRWEGQEKINPSPFDPKGGPAVGRVDNRLAVSDTIVVQEYTQDRNGQTNFTAHGIFRWDAQEKTYAMHWFDSSGFPPSVFKGTFEKGIMILNSADPKGQSRATFDFSKNGEYTFKMEVSQDGKQWYPFMEGRYKKLG